LCGNDRLYIWTRWCLWVGDCVSFIQRRLSSWKKDLISVRPVRIIISNQRLDNRSYIQPPPLGALILWRQEGHQACKNTPSVGTLLVMVIWLEFCVF